MRAKALASSLLYIFVGALAVACGDDGDSSDGGAGTAAGSGGMGAQGGDGSGGRPVLPTPDGGDVPDAGPGEGLEGYPCQIEADCALTATGDQLACVNSNGYGVCARSCTGDADCGTEICISYTGAAADAHCVNLVNEEFGDCGGFETSECLDTAGLTCLYIAQAPIGVCSKICTPAEDDGGVVDPLCGAEQFCRGGVVSDPNGTGMDGVCGTLAARGEECGIFMGTFCGEGDICSPDEPTNEDSTFSCHQDCTAVGSVCDQGECTQVGRSFFCL